MNARLLALTAVLCTLAGVVHAAPKGADMVVYTIPLESSPVKIGNVVAGWKPPDWVPAVHRTAVTDQKVVPVYLQYGNLTQKPICAARFMAAFYDPFNDFLDTFRLVSLDPVAAGQTDYGRWTVPIRDAYLTTSIILLPVQVRFADNTVWRADIPEAVRKSAMTGVLNFEAWHISPDPREYLGQKLKDSGQ